MVAIGKSQPQKQKRSALDYSICVCLTLVLVLAVILIDAYEYIAVPGADRARHHIRTGVDKIHTSVDSMAALMEMMTKDEKEEMRLEVEEAQEAVRKKHDEVEKIVEKVEEMEKEAHEPATTGDHASAAVAATEQEKALEEEKREEIVEAMVEKELGIENWCGSCIWQNMGFNCDKRVAFMIEKYHISEVEAKEANIEHCSNARRLRA